MAINIFHNTGNPINYYTNINDKTKIQNNQQSKLRQNTVINLEEEEIKKKKDQKAYEKLQKNIKIDWYNSLPNLKWF